MTDANPHRRRNLVLIVTAVVVTLAVLVSLVWIIGGRLIGPSTSHITIRDDRLAISVTVPRDLGIKSADTRTDQDCANISYRFGRELSIEMFTPQCITAKSGSRLLNGHHGRYRSIDDVEEPIALESIKTPMGPAQLFTQKYTECTNFCRDYEEHVAIIALNEPADAAFDALVVRADYGKLSREDLTEIVTQMRNLPENG